MRAADGPPSHLILVFAVVVLGYGINGVVGTLMAELFPTHLRSTGPGFCQNLGKGIGGMAGPPIAGALAKAASYPIALALPGVIILVLAGLIWLLPRVSSRELRPIEGDDYLTERVG
jgi:MFS family permease